MPTHTPAILAVGGREFNTANNSFLNWFSSGQSKHPVFSKVTDGMDVVRAIESTKTSHSGPPLTPVWVERITIEE